MRNSDLFSTFIFHLDSLLCFKCHDFLCITAEIEPFWSHLIGARHRTKYMEMVLGLKVEKDKDTVTQMAKEIEKDEGRNITLITRVVSDEKYPLSGAQKGKKEPQKKQNTPTLALTDPDSPVQRLLEAIVSRSQ